MTVYSREQSSPIARQQVLSWLTRQVPDSRIQHILRVEQLAASLAQIHHLDPERAAQAGLMHDLAKYFKPQRLLDIAHQEGWALDPVEVANPHLLHANVSAVVARDEFGVEDQDILDAIADHTLGRPGMGSLSCVVFLADSLEPGRGDSPELHLLRQISRHNLEQAVWMTCDHTLQHLLATRRSIHPRAVQTRNWFLQHASQQRASGVANQGDRSRAVRID